MVSFTSKSIGSEKKEKKRKRDDSYPRLCMLLHDAQNEVSKLKSPFETHRMTSGTKEKKRRNDNRDRRDGGRQGSSAFPEGMYRVMREDYVAVDTTHHSTARRPKSTLSLSSFSPHRILLQSSFPFFSLSFVYTH